MYAAISYHLVMDYNRGSQVPALRPVWAIRHLGRGHIREHNAELIRISSELSRKSGLQSIATQPARASAP